MSTGRQNQNRTAIVYFGPTPQDYLNWRGSSEGNTFDWELNPQSPATWTSEGSIPDSECYLGGTWIEPHREGSGAVHAVE